MIIIVSIANNPNPYNNSDVNKPNGLKMTPYMMAAGKGYIDIVNALISIPGVDINAKNSKGNTNTNPNY